MKNYYFPVFISLIVLVLAYITFTGFYFYDDLSYIKYGFQVAEGKFQIVDDIFNQRWGIIFPLGLIIKVIGSQSYKLVLFPVICIIATIWIIYIASVRQRSHIMSLAILFYIADPYTFNFSSKIYPDNIASPFFLGSLVLLFYRNKNQILNAVLFSLAATYCMLIKETIIYLIPLFLLIFIIDLVRKENRTFWIWAVSVMLILITSYLFVYWGKTGDPFFRIYTIHHGHYQSPYSTYDKNLQSILPRLTTGPFYMLLGTGMFTLAAFSILPLFRSTKFDLNSFDFYWSFLSLYLLVVFFYGSSSLTFYNLLPLFGRMYLPIIPVLAIASSVSVVLYIRLGKGRLILAFVFILAGIISHHLGSEFRIIYFLLGALLILCTLISSLPIKFFHVGLVFILMIYPMNRLRKSDFSGYYEEFVFRKILKQDKERSLVIADDQLVNGHEYYNDFKPFNNISFVSFKDAQNLDYKSLSFGKIYLYINQQNFANLKGSGIYFLSEEIYSRCKKEIFRKGKVCLCETDSTYFRR